MGHRRPQPVYQQDEQIHEKPGNRSTELGALAVLCAICGYCIKLGVDLENTNPELSSLLVSAGLENMKWLGLSYILGRSGVKMLSGLLDGPLPKMFRDRSENPHRHTAGPFRNDGGDPSPSFGFDPTPDQ